MANLNVTLSESLFIDLVNNIFQGTFHKTYIHHLMFEVCTIINPYYFNISFVKRCVKKNVFFTSCALVESVVCQKHHFTFNPSKLTQTIQKNLNPLKLTQTISNNPLPAESTQIISKQFLFTKQAENLYYFRKIIKKIPKAMFLIHFQFCLFSFYRK